MKRWERVAVMAWVAVACGMGSALGNEAEKVLDDLFGPQLKQAKATSSKNDDLALAGELLDKAATTTDQALIAALCNEAWALTWQAPKGYETAVGAMLLLSRRVPAEQDRCRDKLLEILPRMYANRQGEEKVEAGRLLADLLQDSAEARLEAGDPDEALKLIRRAYSIARAVKSDPFGDLQAKLEKITERRRVAVSLRQLEVRLAGDPADSEAGRKLAMLYVVEMDDPNSALQYAGHIDDETRENVRVAARDGDPLGEAECQRLGAWYRQLADQAGDVHKPAMLRRAIGYYERFLRQHEADDLDGAQAEIAVSKLRTQIAAMDRRTFDLLRWVDPVQDTVAGQWKWVGTKLQIQQTECGHILLPVGVEGSYELHFQFCRLTGDGGIRTCIPVGQRKACVVLAVRGRGDTWLSGIGNIKGERARSNETTVRTLRIRNNVLYNVGITVQLDGADARIAVTANNQPLLNWRGPQSVLRLPKVDRGTGARIQTPNVPALGAAASEVNYHMAKLRVLDGTVSPLRPEAALAR